MVCIYLEEETDITMLEMTSGLFIQASKKTKKDSKERIWSLWQTRRDHFAWISEESFPEEGLHAHGSSMPLLFFSTT
jgi:hypothetical protein